jgi:hypothetical protein
LKIFQKKKHKTFDCLTKMFNILLPILTTRSSLSFWILVIEPIYEMGPSRYDSV